MVKTEIIKIDPSKGDLKSQLHKAISLIKSGKLVAFPTETVYGLGADALNPTAVNKIFQAKGRPSDNPIIVHVSSKLMILDLVESLSDDAEKLMSTFFPGPLTLILKKSKIVPLITTGGLDTVAIRCPANEIAQALINFSNTPIAAPSANLSGKPSTTTASDVYEDFEGIIELIIDGGKTEIGLESTVIDVSDVNSKPKILRPGKITKEDLAVCLGYMINKEENSGIVRSPGMKYRHYAPNASLILVQNSEELLDHLERDKNSGMSFIISYTIFKKIHSSLTTVNKTQIYVYRTTQELGSNLFSKLREMDRINNVKTIIIQFDDKSSFGETVYNRLLKAIS